MSVESASSNINENISTPDLSNWLSDQIASEISNTSLRQLAEEKLLLAWRPLLEEKYNQLQDTIEALSIIEEFWEQFDWIDLFSQLIQSLDNSSFTTLLNQVLKNDLKFETYFSTNGFPSSSFELSLLSKEFWIDLDVDINRNNLNKVEYKNADESSIERLTSIYNELPELPGENLISLRLLKELSEWSKSAFIRLKDHLLEDNWELEALLSLLKKNDEKNNTHLYEDFKYTLISISPTFESKIVNFEASLVTEPTIEKAFLASLSWVSPHRNGHFVESKNDHGDEILIDTSKNPPVRTLSLENSSYQMEADRWIWEIYKPQIAYNKEVQRLTPLISSTLFLKSEAVQLHIADLLEHNSTIWEIKSTLTLVYGVDVEYIKTFEDLKVQSLEIKRIEFESDLNKAKSIYKKSLSHAIESRREKVSEEDEKTREVLKFISDIGFDLVDKKYTDQLITEFKTGAIIIPGLNISPGNIDLKNGCFWESANESHTIKWKENLIEFFNKMISWNPGEPIIKEAHLSMGWKTEDRVDMKYNLVQSWILSDMGAFNIYTARENLKKDFNS